MILKFRCVDKSASESINPNPEGDETITTRRLSFRLETEPPTSAMSGNTMSTFSIAVDQATQESYTVGALYDADLSSVATEW